jgi:hypothetical protein
MMINRRKKNICSQVLLIIESPDIKVTGIILPGMRAILHGFLTIFSPLEAIVKHVHISSGFDGVSGFP